MYNLLMKTEQDIQEHVTTLQYHNCKLTETLSFIG